ncbi:hypothetical protein KM043_000704 [Ampulex compressa]|nr:hypothetical protein KM043_000704 [Ampulex compressa]
MSSLEASKSCRICKKPFCCAECRERHEKRKHPDLKVDCPLCCSQKLPLRVFEENSLYAHVVSHHLPLHCSLCGEIFKQGNDLLTFGICKWWSARQRHSLASSKKSGFTTPSPASVCQGNKQKIGSSINGDYLTNFESLTSPPELYRNTSTPMIVGQKTTFDYKTPNPPNFSLKTPKTNSTTCTKNQTRASPRTCPSTDSNSDSKFVSFSPCNSNHGSTPFRSCTEDHYSRGNSLRKLGIMEEREESEIGEKRQSAKDNIVVEDMELTGVEGEIPSDAQGVEVICKAERRTESMKKVRFSDQFSDHIESSNGGGRENVTEVEEYFEARDTMSDTKDMAAKIQNSLLENSAMRIHRETEINVEKENQIPENTNVNIVQETTGSSRVVMMLLVEQNSGLTTSDLTPLIDSGLKKLEERGSLASARTSAPNASTSPGCSGSSVVSVDSYFSVSSVECYSGQPTIGPSSRRDSKSSSDSNESTNSGGIFSAVAHAVRCALKNFSGAGTSKNIARDQVSQRELRSSGVLSSLSSSLLPRPGKRPRDAAESASSSSRPAEGQASHAEGRSPLAKRYRRWHKIKAREPIARMRGNSVTSPRGISSETQIVSRNFRKQNGLADL